MVFFMVIWQILKRSHEWEMKEKTRQFYYKQLGQKVRKSPSIQMYIETCPKKKGFFFTNTRGLLPLAKCGSVHSTNYSKDRPTGIQ